MVEPKLSYIIAYPAIEKVVSNSTLSIDIFHAPMKGKPKDIT